MTIPFYKYQGTGNDFIVIDDLNRTFPSNNIELITRLCDRKFGIGSDGILLLQSDEETDFHLDFINPDGSRSFCGNGSRCAVRFANEIGVIEKECSFNAIDGLHQAKVFVDNIELKMSDVKELKNMGDDIFIDTGSPHHMIFREGVDEIDVKKEGAQIRYNDHYKAHGVNVNFVAKNGEGIFVRTYERGVEDETLSCGTGVTASALAYLSRSSFQPEIKVKTLGGDLVVKSQESKMGYQEIWLCGPAVQVFKGSVEI